MQGRGWGGYAQGRGGMGGQGPMRPEDYFNQMYQQLPGYFNPWIQAGQGALPTLQQQYGQLINDPNAMYNKFAAGYQESPGYQFRQKQGQGAAMNAAAAGGMAGTPQHQQQAAQISEDIANQDFYNYLSSVMGMYGMGLEGMGGLNRTGFEASRGLGEDLTSIMGSQAQMSQWREMMDRMEKMAREQQDSNFWGGILGGLGSLGGSILGGPIGGGIGNWLFGGK